MSSDNFQHIESIVLNITLVGLFLLMGFAVHDVMKKNDCSNSIYNSISFTLDFVSDNPKKVRLICLRSYGESFYHSITDASIEYGYIAI